MFGKTVVIFGLFSVILFVGCKKKGMGSSATPDSSSGQDVHHKVTAGTEGKTSPPRDESSQKRKYQPLQEREKPVKDITPYNSPTYTSPILPSTTKLPDEKKSNTEEYAHYGFQPFKDTQKEALSTFSMDVDTGSYTLCRRKIQEGGLPHQDSIRVEEFINYFKYNYPLPSAEPFGAVIEGAPSPFRKGIHLLRVGLQARKMAKGERKPANLVFLVDTSGSMNRKDRIDLVKQSLNMLVNSLSKEDQISICTYAGNVSVALEPTLVAEKEKILESVNKLQAYGSTRMGEGIVLAYNYAMRSYVKGGMNRVIVCSDGDANVGPRNFKEILKMIEEYKNQGITLTTLGFGVGNYKDTMMEQLANQGNGNYYYLDSIAEARKIFVEQIDSTLQVVAYDAKIQVEFNPAKIARFRLIGYENRKLKHEDFRKDQVDAGEVGPGHSVTALYEIEFSPPAQEKRKESVTDGKYWEDMLVLRIRYKEDVRAKSKEQTFYFQKFFNTFEDAPQKFQLAVMVAETAEILRGSPYTKTHLSHVVELMKSSISEDKEEQEFAALVAKAAGMKK